MYMKFLRKIYTFSLYGPFVLQWFLTIWYRKLLRKRTDYTFFMVTLYIIILLLPSKYKINSWNYRNTKNRTKNFSQVRSKNIYIFYLMANDGVKDIIQIIVLMSSLCEALGSFCSTCGPLNSAVHDPGGSLVYAPRCLAWVLYHQANIIEAMYHWEWPLN